MPQDARCASLKIPQNASEDDICVLFSHVVLSTGRSMREKVEILRVQGSVNCCTSALWLSSRPPELLTVVGFLQFPLALIDPSVYLQVMHAVPVQCTVPTELHDSPVVSVH